MTSTDDTNLQEKAKSTEEIHNEDETVTAENPLNLENMDVDDKKTENYSPNRRHNFGLCFLWFLPIIHFIVQKYYLKFVLKFSMFN